MTTKSYTDIPQSETLSKILSPESADMYYPNRADIQYQGALPIGMKHGNPLLSQEIPAWSIVALLNAAPQMKIRGSKKIGYIVYYNKNIASNRSFNIIDACYEMIIKLNEQNLL